MVDNDYEPQLFDSPRKELNHVRATISQNRHKRNQAATPQGKATFQLRPNDTFDKEIRVDTAGYGTLDNLSSEEEDMQSSEPVKDFTQKELLYDTTYSNTKWMIGRGKDKFISFDPKQTNTLRTVFDELDRDGSGQIGIDELEDPLIAMGVAETRAEVQKLIKINGLQAGTSIESQRMDFDEFLSILRLGSTLSAKNVPEKEEEEKNKARDQKELQVIKEQTQTKDMYKFFHGVASGKLKQGEMKDVPLNLFISAHRRKNLLDGLMGNGDKKKEGTRILKNFKQQVEAKQQREQSKSPNRGQACSTLQSQSGMPDKTPPDINILRQILDGTHSSSFK